MENSILDSDLSTGSDSGLSSKSISFLKETAKWSKFLSIIGFVFLGLMVIGAISILIFGSNLNSTLSASRGFNQSAFPTTLVAFLYLVMAVLYFFPILYLYNFATKMKNALQMNDNNLIESAFENLKSHYKFIGIFTIVILAIYALIFLFGLITAIFA